MEPIILASQSPQRQTILRQLNIPFISIPAETDEAIIEGLSPEENVEQIAIKKAEAVLRSPLKTDSQWIIAADTLIFLKEKPFGKPSDAEQARSMLCSYSNTSHKVITSICCCNTRSQRMSTRTGVSTVHFKKLTDEEIEWYLRCGEWQGAAGAYRIQGMAACFISKIEGSYSGIVGLPMYELYAILTEHGYHFN